MFRHNLYQIIDDEDAIYEFESEALLAYYDRLSNYLKQQGYYSVAELKGGFEQRINRGLDPHYGDSGCYS